MQHLKNISFLLLFCGILGCKNASKSENTTEQAGTEIPVDYATGFSITNYGTYKLLEVSNPWPKSKRAFTYLLIEKNTEMPQGISYDQKISIPVENVVVTSTTHISSLETLGELKTLMGFPGLHYISSEKARKRIAEGKVKELGKNENLNTEILLQLQPDLVIGFAVNGQNKSLNTIEKNGIPVVFNSDWTETSPLGKAEWIKFFGAFFNKTAAANRFFEQIENNYLAAKELAKSAVNTPTVLAGSMYRDQWFLPAGDSWNAQFIADANADYLFSDHPGKGSISLAFENVLAKAKAADFWVGPAEFQSYKELLAASPHYGQFKAFRQKNIYTYSSEKGETGGVLFYELAPLHPDLVLKDLISIFHPELLPDYHPWFYKPLK